MEHLRQNPPKIPCWDDLNHFNLFQWNWNNMMSLLSWIELLTLCYVMFIQRPMSVQVNERRLQTAQYLPPHTQQRNHSIPTIIVFTLVRDLSLDGRSMLLCCISPLSGQWNIDEIQITCDLNQNDRSIKNQGFLNPVEFLRIFNRGYTNQFQTQFLVCSC